MKRRLTLFAFAVPTLACAPTPLEPFTGPTAMSVAALPAHVFERQLEKELARDRLDVEALRLRAAELEATRERFVVGSKTEAYLLAMDLDRWRALGADYGNPRYDVARLGLPASQIDTSRSFDFAWTAALEQALAGVDRRRVLAEIWRRLTDGARDDTERHLRVLEFLQAVSVHHPVMQPVYEDGMIVSDPLVLLELGMMRCGHVARVAVDLFEAGGYPGRLVQLGGHVIAEVFYGGAWHYFDADLTGSGAVARLEDGSIPSVLALGLRPALLDAVPARTELAGWSGVERTSQPYASWNYFARESYLGAPPVFYVKRPDADVSDRYYGWLDYDVVPDPARPMFDRARFDEPGGSTWVRARASVDGLALRWAEAVDPDGDLTAYRVYVSRIGRGWSYPSFDGPRRLARLWAGDGWDASMYPALADEPPSDVALVETSTTHAELTLEPGTYFVSFSPVDAHGRAVGRRRFVVSPQLELVVPERREAP